MTQEEKELLLKDLCARLPYGVKLGFYASATKQTYICTLLGLEPQEDEPVIAKTENGSFYMLAGNVKPYLFPLSSMSEEQKKYISDRWGVNEDFDFEIDPNWGKYFVDLGDAVGFINWCYENHFDINGLIPRGLAEDVTDKSIY